ncbi:MAG TPA: hydrolase [Candidatus Babeliales bacterium]|nr:hydrolase [Candidatus Babeliales bacterium]
MEKKYTDFLTPQNCALALIDYQPAMYFGVQSHDRITIMHNSLMLAKTAKLFNVPTVLSAIAQNSFSGPMNSDLQAVFPNQEVIDRTAINAWLDASFRKAVEGTNRKKIVVAGLWTEACVLFPTLELLKAGYDVYIPTDACGDISLEAHERSVQRMIQAGATPINALQFICELQQDWARSETYNGVMDILKAHSPYGIQVTFSKWALGKHSS